MQVIWEAVLAVTAQSTPSMVTTAAATLRYCPVRVKVYPPLIYPYLGLTAVTIGVVSCLNSAALLKVWVLNPSL